MSKPFFFLYGNCQMNRIAGGLGRQPDIKRQFEVRRLRNFKVSGDDADPGHQALMEEFERQAANTRVLVYQADAWDKNADSVLQQLPQDCIRVPIFSVAMSTLWPFYFKDIAIRKIRVAGVDADYFPYGDTFLTRRVKQGADPDVIVREYLALDVNAVTPLDDWRAANLAGLRKKEESSVVRVADHIEASFTEERHFWTLNHAANPVFRLVVGQILAALGMADLDEASGAAFAAQQGFGDMLHHPVHPSVIEHFGLRYLRPDTIYKHYEEAFDFEEWVRRYVAMSRQAHGLVDASAA